METPNPIPLPKAFLNQLNEVTTSYSQLIVDEYMNAPAAPTHKYRPQVIGHEGISIPAWYRYDALSHHWSAIESNLNNRFRRNSFRAADSEELEVIIATERHLALSRGILFYLLSLKKSIETSQHYERETLKEH